MTKQHILAEIRRTTKENGGAPLGQRKFRAETGIRDSDWLGVYWARWSEALRECGIAPNKLTEAYGREELLQKYAELATELGRLPLRGDLMLKTTTTPGFPSDRPYRKFGGKVEMTRALRDYCATAGPAEVVRMCDEYLVGVNDGEEPESEDVGEFVVGFVYLIKSGRHYKIGKTNALGRRERELAIQLPERASTVHKIRTDDPAGIEAYWHRRFEDRRKNGEWFDLTAQDVAAFRRRKFM